MAFLIDTNVASELRKKHNADLNVVAWQAHTDATKHWISVISLMEIRLGVQKALNSDPNFAKLLHEWYQSQLLPSYEGRILNVDLDVAEIRANFPIKRTLPYSDALIGATAKHHNLTLVTRNTKDFEDFGIHLINPWEHPHN